MIQVLIHEYTVYGHFNDALYYSEEEYSRMTPAQIEAAKAERVNNWINLMQNIPQIIEE